MNWPFFFKRRIDFESNKFNQKFGVFFSAFPCSAQVAEPKWPFFTLFFTFCPEMSIFMKFLVLQVETGFLTKMRNIRQNFDILRIFIFSLKIGFLLVKSCFIIIKIQFLRLLLLFLLSKKGDFDGFWSYFQHFLIKTWNRQFSH